MPAVDMKQVQADEEQVTRDQKTEKRARIPVPPQ
jgi:hypothetical protein